MSFVIVPENDCPGLPRLSVDVAVTLTEPSASVLAPGNDTWNGLASPGTVWVSVVPFDAVLSVTVVVSPGAALCGSVMARPNDPTVA